MAQVKLDADNVNDLLLDLSDGVSETTIDSDLTPVVEDTQIPDEGVAPVEELPEGNQPPEEEEHDLIGTDTSKWTDKQINAYRALQQKNQKNFEEKQRIAQEVEKRDQENALLKKQIEEINQRLNPVPKEEPPKPPERPQRPANYNPYDALSDPDSESYKFRESMETYRDEEAKFQAKKIDLLTDTITKEREFAALQTKAAQTKAAIVGKFATELSPTEAEQAFQFFNSPESLTPEFMAKAYKAVVKGETIPTTKSQTLPKKNSPPVPGVGADSRQSDSTFDPDAEFSASLTDANVRNLH